MLKGGGRASMVPTVRAATNASDSSAAWEKFVSLVMVHDLTKLLQDLQESKLAPGVLEVQLHLGNFGEWERVGTKYASVFHCCCHQAAC